jgi:hypothetical protein
MACEPLELDWSLKHLDLMRGLFQVCVPDSGLALFWRVSYSRGIQYFYIHYYFIIALRHRHMHAVCLTGCDKGPTVLAFRGGVVGPG